MKMMPYVDNLIDLCSSRSPSFTRSECRRAYVAGSDQYQVLCNGIVDGHRTYALHDDPPKTMSNEYDGPLMRMTLSTCAIEVKDQLSTMIIQLLCGKVISMTPSMGPRVVTPGPHTSSWYSFRQQITKPHNAIPTAFIIAGPGSFPMAVESMDGNNAFRESDLAFHPTNCSRTDLNSLYNWVSPRMKLLQPPWSALLLALLPTIDCSPHLGRAWVEIQILSGLIGFSRGRMQRKLLLELLHFRLC